MDGSGANSTVMIIADSLVYDFLKDHKADMTAKAFLKERRMKSKIVKLRGLKLNDLFKTNQVVIKYLCKLRLFELAENFSKVCPISMTCLKEIPSMDEIKKQWYGQSSIAKINEEFSPKKTFQDEKVKRQQTDMMISDHIVFQHLQENGLLKLADEFSKNFQRVGEGGGHFRPIQKIS